MVILSLCTFWGHNTFPSKFPLGKSRTYFTTLGLSERMQHCYHLYQERVYSPELMEPMGLARCFFGVEEELKQLTEMNWS